MDEQISIGGQIRHLREQARLQANDLASALKVDPAVISNIEHDRRAVKASELGTIASFLGVSQLAILEPDSLLGRLPVAARSVTGPVDDAVMNRLVAIAELHQVLSDGGHEPQSVLAPPLVRSGEGWLHQADALAAWATKTLDYSANGGTAFESLVHSIESRLRVDVLVESVEGATAFGASITDPEFPLIYVNTDQPLTRALFTLAHELGHVLSGDGDALNIDIDLSARSDSERLANAFAASLLMPRQEVQRILHEGRGWAESLAEMMVAFGVSYKSLVYRLHNLGVINAGHRDSFQKIGWSGLVSSLPEGVLRGALLAARGATPQRRSPALLTLRCLSGVEDGTVGAAPLAGLLGISANGLITMMSPEAPEPLVPQSGPVETNIDTYDASPV